MRVPRSALPVSLVFWALAQASAARAETDTRERHDGFYLRLSAGAARMDVERRTDHTGETTTLAYSGDTSSVSGWGPFGEFSVGGTPAEHVVVAGTLLGWVLPAPTLVVGGGPRFNLAGPLGVFLLAPTVDVFPNPLGGFHLGGGAGLAVVTVRLEDPSFRSIGGTGAGFTAHLGYDLWTADEWSVGLLGRATFAVVGSEQTASAISGHEHDTMSSLSLAATLLHH